jgi:hypothetical protein
MCMKHYYRVRRHGDPSISFKAEHGTGGMANGYRVYQMPGHQLANARGSVYAHRLALFGAIGPGVHPCHWCAKPVLWGSPLTLDRLVTDHLDGDQLNNDPANLVPSCSGCNATRGRAGNPRLFGRVKSP